MGNVGPRKSSDSASFLIFWLFFVPILASVYLSYQYYDPGYSLFCWFVAEALVVASTVLFFRYVGHEHNFVKIRGYRLCRWCGELRNESDGFVRKLRKADKKKLLEIYESDRLERIRKLKEEDRIREDKLREKLGIQTPMKTEKTVRKIGEQKGHPVNAEKDQREARPVSNAAQSGAKKHFADAEDKLGEASLSFEKEDYPSTMNNLNTALELLLKDKLGIPTTISQINTSNVIDVCVRYKVGPYDYLAEAKKHVCLIDNKVKHQGYKPLKTECINAIKSVEELVHRLKGVEIKLSEDVKQKIRGKV